MYTIKSTNVQQADSMNAQTNNKTRQEEKSLKFQEISAKNEMISMNFLKKVIQVVTKQYMRLQKQQLAFLVACAVVSAKHIRRFLRDLKIISMFLFTFIIRYDFGQVREDLNLKKTFSFGHCPNYLSPHPPWPQFGQLGPLFSEVEIQDLKVSLELRILYILYNILYMSQLMYKFS